MTSFYEVIEINTGSNQIAPEGRLEVSTCTLIKGKFNCIVNTMIPIFSELIEKSLETHGLKHRDINYVISRNGEYGNIGGNHLFLRSIHIVGHTITNGNSFIKNELELGKEFLIDGDNLKILPTPGPTLRDITVLVKTSEDCVVAITGLFEKEEDIQYQYMWLSLRPECPSLQRYHRDCLIKSVQRIIPAHGQGFDVTKRVKKEFEKYREAEPKLSLRDLYRIGIF